MARPKIFRNLPLVMLVSLLAGIVLAEFALRTLLFHERPWAARLAGNLRQAGNFARSDTDEFWKLRRLFTPPPLRQECTAFDPEVGWTSDSVAPGSFAHACDTPGNGRSEDERLVLLYGDSFAECVIEETGCFPAILEDSDLRARYTMLNYGVGGYGLDQTYLLLRASIDLHAARKPVVVIGLLAENALDRTTLSMRDWPKPRLRVIDGSLVADGPVIDGCEAHMARHPLSIPSYVLRYIAHRGRLLPEFVREPLRGESVSLAEKQAIARELLRAIDRELDARGIEYFFVLFHARGALVPPNWAPWQEPLIREVCAETGARVVSTRPYLLAATGLEPDKPSRFYIHSGPGVGHMNEIGNRIAFEAIADGLEGRAEPTCREFLATLEQRPFRALSRVETAFTLFDRNARIVTDGASPRLRTTSSHAPPFTGWPDLSRTCLATGDAGPTHVAVELAGRARTLRASARATVYGAGESATGRLVLRIEADGRAVWRAELEVGGDPVAIDVDLSGVERLTIGVASCDSTPRGAWICLSDPSID